MQIFAATNGYLDRLNVEQVPEFLLGLIDRLHAQHPELRAKITGGDWSEETQDEVRDDGRRVRQGLRLRPRRGGPAAGRRRASAGARLAATQEPQAA